MHMPTTLEATRLWMLALCIASIPLALLWEAMRRPSLVSHRHHLPALPWPLSIHVPFVVAVVILTTYLVVALVSNTR
jgi:hypothetical protein